MRIERKRCRDGKCEVEVWEHGKLITDPLPPLTPPDTNALEHRPCPCGSPITCLIETRKCSRCGLIWSAADPYQRLSLWFALTVWLAFSPVRLVFDAVTFLRCKAGGK